MKKHFRILPLAILSLLLLVGSAAQAQMTEEELSMQRIKDKINILERSMATMQQELYKTGKSSKKQPSDEPVGDDAERTRAMNGKFEEVEHNITTLAAKLDKIIADIDFRLTALEKTVSANAAAAAASAKPVDTAAQNTPADTASTEKPEAEVVSQATPTTTQNAGGKTEGKKAATSSSAQYDKAFEFLRLAKYDEAERAFKDFIANNKGSDLIGNSYYWLGETYFARENYQQAAVNFLKGYQDFPKGTKAPDNLLKLAMSLKNLKKEKEACATLDKMKKEYKSMDKDLLAKANAESKGLKCH